MAAMPADFEGASLAPWTATGSAWGITHRVRAGRRGAAHAESLCGGESATGALRSAPFVIDGPAIVMLVNGWPGDDRMGRNCVRLLRAGDRSVLREARPPASDAFAPLRWEVRDLIGQRAYVEAIDDARGGAFAWLGIDDLRVLSTPAKRASARAPVRADISGARLVIENAYYRFEFDRRVGVFDRCFLDAGGRAPRFSPDLFGRDGGMGFVGIAPPERDGVFAVRSSRKGGVVRARIGPLPLWAGSSLAVAHVAGDEPLFKLGIQRRPVPRIAALAYLTLTARPDSPVMRVDLEFGPRAAGARDLADAGAFIARFAAQTSPAWVCYGGRKARVYHDGRPPDLLRDHGVPAAGVVEKSDPNLCLRLEWDRPNVPAICGTTPGCGLAGLAPGISDARRHIALRLVPGPPGIEGPAGMLRSTISSADPAAETFIFWLSHLGTVRDFDGRLLQATAAHLSDFTERWLTDAYSACWTRDIAYGWRSGIYVAGPALLDVLRDEIEVLGAAHNAANWSPTGAGERLDFFYSNLDSMSHLIGMTHDYFAKTGDAKFLRAQVPNLRRQGDAMLALIDGASLPVIPADGETWPDVGKVHGRQTYLAALCYCALRDLSRLLQYAGQPGFARYDAAAEALRAAANLPVSQGGLWAPERGAFISWRGPDGAVHPPDTHGNLSAILTGLCDDPARIASIFACLDSQWQRIYEGGMTPLAYNVDPADDTLRQWLPWIAGLDIAARARNRNPRAAETYRLLMAEYRRSPLPFREASGGLRDAVHGGNSGRVWDSWSLLYAIYNAHFGIDLTAGHVRVHPYPLFPIAGQKVKGLRWQGRSYDLCFTGEGSAVAGVRFGGADLPSCVLADKSGAVELAMGPGRTQPMLDDASDGVRLRAASLAGGSLALEVTALTETETLSIIWPARLGQPEARGLAAGDGVHYDSAANTLAISLRGRGGRNLRIRGERASGPSAGNNTS